jgi:hypothetical protein
MGGVLGRRREGYNGEEKGLKFMDGQLFELQVLHSCTCDILNCVLTYKFFFHKVY